MLLFSRVNARISLRFVLSISLISQMLVGQSAHTAPTSTSPASSTSTAKPKTTKPAKEVLFGEFNFKNKLVGEVLLAIYKKHPDISFYVGQPMAIQQELSNLDSYTNYFIDFQTDKRMNMATGMRALSSALNNARKRIDPNNIERQSISGEFPLILRSVIKQCPDFQASYVVMSATDPEDYCPSTRPQVAAPTTIKPHNEAIIREPGRVIRNVFQRDSFTRESVLNAFAEQAVAMADILSGALPQGQKIMIKVSTIKDDAQVMVTTDSPRLIAQLNDLADQLNAPPQALTPILYNVEFRQLNTRVGKDFGYSLIALSKAGYNFQGLAKGASIINNTMTSGLPSIGINKGSYSALISNENSNSKTELITTGIVTSVIGRTALYSDGGSMNVDKTVQVSPSAYNPYPGSYTTSTPTDFGLDLEFTAKEVQSRKAGKRAFEIEMKYKNVALVNVANVQTQNNKLSTTFILHEDEVQLVAGSSNASSSSSTNRGFWILSRSSTTDNSKNLAFMAISINVGDDARIIYPKFRHEIYSEQSVEAYFRRLEFEQKSSKQNPQQEEKKQDNFRRRFGREADTNFTGG